MIIHHKPKKSRKASTETVAYTKELQKHGLHYPCVSKETIALLLEIQAEPLPMAQKIRGRRNIKSPSTKPGASIGPLVTNKLVVADFEACIYRVTWQGDSYINQLREVGLI